MKKKMKKYLKKRENVPEIFENLIILNENRHISVIWEVNQNSSELSVSVRENFFLHFSPKIIKIGSRSLEKS